jgi:hypothetical protein
VVLNIEITIILVGQNQFLHYQSNQRLFSIIVKHSEATAENDAVPIGNTNGMKVCGISKEKIILLGFWIAVMVGLAEVMNRQPV